ncbi:MAG TPA: DUF6348 family protein, partial [Microcoleaceae cyanobacterium]
MDASLEAGLRAVVGHLRLDGFNARIGEDCAYLGIGEIALVITWSQFQPSPSGSAYSAALEVALRVGKDALLFQDVVANPGMSKEEAVSNALLNVWLHGDLPPILPLIGGPLLPNVQVLRKGDTLYCSPWVIYSGPCQYGGSQCEDFMRFIQEQPPLLTIRELLAREVDPKQFHWIKLFRSRSIHGFDEADFLLDGEPFELGASALMNWDWLGMYKRYSFRQFMVLLPEDFA